MANELTLPPRVIFPGQGGWEPQAGGPDDQCSILVNMQPPSYPGQIAVVCNTPETTYQVALPGVVQLVIERACENCPLASTNPYDNFFPYVGQSLELLLAAVAGATKVDAVQNPDLTAFLGTGWSTLVPR